MHVPTCRRSQLRSGLRAAILVVAASAGLSGGVPGSAFGQQVSLLSAGWNNVLYTGPSGPIATVLAPLSGRLEAVHVWDALAQRWHSYYPTAPQSGDMQMLLGGQVYWFSLQAAGVLPAGSASPAPAQAVSGWNNVVYFGAGAPGSAILEQSTLWAWDSGGQRWLRHDPNSPGTSDFQTLSPLTAYWLFVSTGQSIPTPGAPPAQGANPAPSSLVSGCYPFTSSQPAMSEIDDTLVRAGSGAVKSDPSLAAEPEKVGLDSAGTMQPPYIPPTLLRAIAWVESAWHQATWTTQRGQSGPTLTSRGCAYGLMQIATGMSVETAPSSVQLQIGRDFRANAAAGAQLLTRNWNRDPGALPYVGQRDPRILEDWYFAAWACHCFGDGCTSYGAHDNPDDPSLPWPRPAFNSADQLAGSTSFGFGDYPYQELVYGLVANPPAAEGRPLWRSIGVELPPHGSVGFPVPRPIAEPSAHLEDGRSLVPAGTRAATAP